MFQGTECIFLPNKPEKNGYVRVGRGRPGVERSAHRKAWADAYGPIPEGYTIDHECHNADEDCPGGVCRHRACVNPLHLSAKTSGANTLAGKNPAAINARREVCAQGHEFTEGNTKWWNGHRQCRMCQLLDHQRRHALRKAREWGLSDISDP